MKYNTAFLIALGYIMCVLTSINDKLGHDQKDEKPLVESARHYSSHLPGYPNKTGESPLLSSSEDVQKK